jgi:hypothetical protein
MIKAGMGRFKVEVKPDQLASLQGSESFIATSIVDIRYTSRDE